MGTVKSLIRIIIVTSWMALLMKVFPVVLSYPHGTRVRVDHRMFMPPTFPNGGLPPGYTSSGLFCGLFNTGPYRIPYQGGWFNRACQGPLPPFNWPSSTTTTTTAKPPVAAGAKPPPKPRPAAPPTFLNPANPYADYGDPIEGNPWEPDDEALLIENQGRSASDPNFQLGDPSRRF